MFETSRLKMEKYTLDDVQDYFTLKSCEKVWVYSSFTPFHEVKQAEAELQKVVEAGVCNEMGFLAVSEKKTGQFIGEAGIIGYNGNANRCEIGYNLLPEFWGKGYAKELVSFLVRYSFETLKIERVEALVIEDNIASCRVLEKSGFMLEGVLRNFNRNGRLYRNVCYYAMISDDYRNK